MGSRFNTDVGKLDFGIGALFGETTRAAEGSEEGVTDIPLTELHPFRGHPYKVEADDDLYSLSASIRDNGVIQPGIARPRPEGGYELVSGHRRKEASRLAGRDTMPVRIVDMDDDEAVVAMVDSNMHRARLLPSEKAYAYKMRMDAVRHKGRKGGNTAAGIGGESGDSARTVCMQNRYTPEAYRLLEQIMANLAYEFRPLNLGELRSLCSKAREDFDTVFIRGLNELEPFIFYGREKRFTTLRLNNIRYSDWLKDFFKPCIRDMVENWIERLLKEHRGKKPENYKESNGFYENSDYSVQGYLHAYLYDYVIELRDDNLMGRALEPDFIECLINYERYRNSANSGENGIRQDVRVCSAALALMEERTTRSLDNNPFLYCQMLNDRAYLNNLLREYEEMERDIELLDEFKEKCLNGIDRNDEEYVKLSALRAKLYNNIGSYVFQRGNDYPKAESLFRKSLDIRDELRKADFKEYSEECLQTYINLLDVYTKMDLPDKGKEVYGKGKELADKIQTYVVERYGPDERERLILGELRKHRVEYGHTYLSAVLQRKYGMFMRKTNLAEAERSLLKAIRAFEAINEEEPTVQAEVAAIICYYELAVIYPAKAEEYLIQAGRKCKCFEESGKMKSDSRYADIFYRRYLIEKEKESPDERLLSELLEDAGHYIRYVEQKDSRKWLTHERQVYEAVKEEERRRKAVL